MYKSNILYDEKQLPDNFKLHTISWNTAKIYSLVPLFETSVNDVHEHYIQSIMNKVSFYVITDGCKL